jgi:hypothetical protein
MEVCGDDGTQYGKLKKYIISFLLKNGDVTCQYSGDEMFVGGPLNNIV